MCVSAIYNAMRGASANSSLVKKGSPLCLIPPLPVFLNIATACVYSAVPQANSMKPNNEGEVYLLLEQSSKCFEEIQYHAARTRHSGPANVQAFKITPE